MNQGAYWRSVPRDGWDEVFFTALPEEAIADEQGARDFFARVGNALQERHACVLQEKIYGRKDHAEALLAVREEALLASGADANGPVTFIDGSPCVGGLLAGVQIIGAIPRSADVTCQTLFDGQEAVGRMFKCAAGEVVFLAGVSGLSEAGQTDVGQQAETMLRRAKARLEDAGLSVAEIVRTWIYLPRLLDWYGEFNRVRTACFREFGLMPETGERFLPASTGIQGSRRAGEECFMDVMAVAPANGQRAGITPMHSRRQNEAYEYGSSFARGMRVALGGPPTLYVSGTASISPKGETVYHGDGQGQILETLLDVHALLASEAARLRDVCQATVYCKTLEDYATFQEILELTNLEDVPFVCVEADVCRDELLFEMDAVAVAGASA